MICGARRLAAAFAFVVVWPAAGHSTTITFSPANPKPGETVTATIVTFTPTEVTVAGVNIGAKTIAIEATAGYNFCARDLTLVRSFTAPARPGIYDVEFYVTTGSERRLIQTTQLVVSNTCDFGHSLTADPASVIAGDAVTLTWCNPGYHGIDAGYYVHSYRLYSSQSPSGPFTSVLDLQGETKTQTQVKPNAGTTYYYAESHGCEGVLVQCPNAPDTTKLSSIVAVNAAAPGACLPGPTTLCVANGRFEITARWQAGDGRNGDGRPVQVTENSGYFWFFDRKDVEVTVKVGDACTLQSPAFWLFASGMTNVRVDLTVMDTQSKAVKHYTNPLGTTFATIIDTHAFGCP